MTIRNITLCTPQDIQDAIEKIPTNNLTTEQKDLMGYLHHKTVEWVNNRSVYKDFDQFDRDTIALVYLSWYIQDHAGTMPGLPEVN